MLPRNWFLNFPWESEEQRKGFAALLQFIVHLPNDVRPSPIDDRIATVAAWFIQKQHESNQWWSETIGAQIRSIEDQIKILQSQLDATNQYVNRLIAVTKEREPRT